MADVLTGKNADAESTSVNTNPAEHTPVEQRVIDEYRNSTDAALVDFVQRAAQNPGGKERYTLNPVSERAAADIKKLPALIQPVIRRFLNSVWQSTFFGVTAKMARQIRHRGRSQAYVTNENGKNRPAKTVVFSKAVNGTYYVVEAVPDTSKHMTYITSANITKNKPTGVQSADALAPTLTAKPEADLPVGTQNVPKAAPNVNTEGLETRLLQTVETVRDAAVTPDAVKQSINENIENGGYIGISRNPTPTRWLPRALASTGWRNLRSSSPPNCWREKLTSGAVEEMYIREL